HTAQTSRTQLERDLERGGRKTRGEAVRRVTSPHLLAVLLQPGEAVVQVRTVRRPSAEVGIEIEATVPHQLEQLRGQLQSLGRGARPSMFAHGAEQVARELPRRAHAQTEAFFGTQRVVDRLIEEKVEVVAMVNRGLARKKHQILLQQVPAQRVDFERLHSCPHRLSDSKPRMSHTERSKSSIWLGAKFSGVLRSSSAMPERSAARCMAVCVSGA